MIVFASLCNNT